jgi:hypothetical protein
MQDYLERDTKKNGKTDGERERNMRKIEIGAEK